MAEELDNTGTGETNSGAEQNLQTLDALHLDGKGAPTLEDADERSLTEMGDTRPEDVTGNANVQSAERTTYEQMVLGGIREEPVVPTADHLALDTVNPTFRDNNVDARFDNVQPRFNPVGNAAEFGRPEPERDESGTAPDLLVSRDPVRFPQGDGDEEGGDAATGAPAAAASAPPVEDEHAPPAEDPEVPAETDEEIVIPKVADAPSVLVSAAAGTEDTDTKLDIRIATVDRDGGSETISAITIGNVPAGFSFVDAAGNPVGIQSGAGWSFTLAQLDDLYLRQPGDYSGDIALSVTATSQESNGSTATTTMTLNVHVEAVADAPSLDVADSAGMENTLIPLSITVGNNDAVLEGAGAYAPETQTVYISNLPAGATLYIGDAAHPVTAQVGGAGLTIDGTTIPAGAYVISAADLPNLKVQSPSNDSHDFTLNVWATSTEPSNGDVAITGFQTIEVDVGVNAPGASGSGTGQEGGWADLTLSASVNFPDGTENLRVFIADLEPGAVLAYGDGTPVPVGADGRYEVTGRLDDLKVGWPGSDEDKDIDFNLVAEVRDGDTDTDSDAVRAAAPDFASTTVPVTVTIQAVADGPSSLSASGIGVEDKWFDLNVTTGLLDTDGSETLTVTITGPVGFQLAAANDTDHPYTGVTSSGTVTYTLTPAQLQNLQMRAAADSDADIDLRITATARETAEGDGQIALETKSTSIDLNVKILSDADKPVVSVIKDTQTINEDGLFDLSKTLSGTFNDGAATHAAVTGAATEAGSALGATDSADQSETITYRITANQDSVVSLDGGATKQAFRAGATIEVAAADIASGKVQLGGVDDWASSAAHPTLTFSVVTVATEDNAAADDGLESGLPAGLTRESVRVSDPAVLTIAVNPVADASTARLSVVASGYEDGLAGLADHTANATGSGIDVVPTLTLTDADLSEAPTGVVTITSSDAAMLAGSLTISGSGASIVRVDSVDAGGNPTATWTITGGTFATTAANTFQLGGLVFHPAANNDADPVYDISVQFQDTDGGPLATVAATDQTITVTAVADKPTLTVQNTAAWESASGERLIPLNVTTASVDTDGSETQTVYLTDLPSAEGSVIGTNVVAHISGTHGGLTATAGNPVYEIPAADLGSLQLRINQGYSSDVQLKVVAASVEREGDVAYSDPATLRVDIGVLDPVISGNAVTGLDNTFGVSGVEDSKISLSSVKVDVTAPGDNETRTVFVEVPTGVTLYAGSNGSALTRISFTDAQGVSHSGYNVTNNLTAAGNLNVSAKNNAGHSDANFELKVYALVRDQDSGNATLDTAYANTYHDTAQSVATVQVTVKADADAATLNGSAVAVEDKWVNLNLSASLTDTDGSENLTVTIAGVPAGLTLTADGVALTGTVAGNTTTYTIGPCATNAEMQSALSNLKLTGLDQGSWANTDGSFGLTVTATTTESATGSEVAASTRNVTRTVTVDILSNADTPVVQVESAPQTIAEDAFFSLHTRIGDHFAVEGKSGEAGSLLGADASADGSESLSFRITPVEAGSRLAIDGGGDGQISADDLNAAGQYWNATGGYWEVPAALVNGNKVWVGGAANWASTSDSDNLHFDIRTVATEARDGSASGPADMPRAGVAVSDPLRLTLNVTPVADSTNITLSGNGIEDQVGGIAFVPTIRLADTDGSETLTGTVDILVRCDAAGAFPGSIAYSGTGMVDGQVETYEGATYHVFKVPAAALSGSPAGGYTLSGLTFAPTANSDLDIQYRVRVTTTEGANSNSYVTVSSLANLDVSAVADAPVLSIGAAGSGSTTVVGLEDSVIRLDLAAELQDVDGSEVLTNAELRDVPEGWGVITVDASGNKLSSVVGVDADGDHKYTFVLDPRAVTPGSGIFVALVPPANSDVDATGITFWAKATEVAGNPNDPDPSDNQVVVPTAERSITFNVQVNPDADTPVLQVTSARGNEDTSIPLDIRTSVTDADETAMVEITGVPSGGVLTYRDADGALHSTTFGDTVTALTVTPAEARTLHFIPPADASGKITLNVRSISTDGDTENAAVSDSTDRTATLDVYVKGVNDEILDQNGVAVTATSGNLTAGGTEDHLINLNLGEYSVADDDGSETLSAVIQGLPAGFTLVVKTADGIVDTADVLQYIGEDRNGAPIWSVPEDYLQYVNVRPPANFAGDFDLSIRLVTTEDDGAATAIDKTLTVSVEAAADAPSVSVSASVNEDGWDGAGIPIEITAKPVDTTTESAEYVSQITIDMPVPAGLPAGTQLKLQLGDTVVNVGSGTEFTIKEGDALWSHYDAATGKLSGLTLLGVPDGWSKDLPITVTATSTDINDTTATSTANASVVIRAVADEPEWTLGSGASYTPGDGGLPDVGDLGHAISNMVFYLETPEHSLIKVKIDNFSDVGLETLRDPNYVNIDGFISQHYSDCHLVAFTTKAGNNKVGDSNSEGVLTIVDPTLASEVDTSASFDVTHQFQTLYNADASHSIVLATPNNVTASGGGWSGATGIDQAVDLGLDVTRFNDPDGSESIYFIVSDVPNGVTLNHGFNNGDGTWTVHYDATDTNWTLTATSHYSGHATLKVTPVVVDKDPNGGTDTKVFDYKLFELVVADADGGVAGSWPSSTGGTAPSLTGTPGSGTEGDSFGLGGVQASAAAGDTLSAVVLVSLPADVQVVGTTDSAGNTIAWYNPVSGSWTIDPAHLADFKVKAHGDQAGTVALNLRAVAQDGALTTTASGSISVVTLAPETDGATITASVSGGMEDASSIPIDLRVSDNESKYFSESLAGGTLTVTIGTVKGNDGAQHLPGTLKTGTLADGTVVTADAAHPGTYTIQLTQAQIDAFAGSSHAFTLSGLEFVPAANYSGSVSINFAVDVQDTGTDVETSTGSVTFNVSPVIDATTAEAVAITGQEDLPIPLDLTINHQDLAGTGHWGSETVSVVISGVPEGARIEGATNNGPTTANGVTTYSWTVERSSAHMEMTAQGITLKGVNYVSPTDDSSDVQLTVTTYVFEKGIATPSSTSTTITVGVDGVTDGATLNPNNASGLEDQLVAMDLGAQLVDITGSSEVTHITIAGVPDGATLRDAAGHAVGTAGPVDAETCTCTWTLSTSEVASLGLLDGGKVYFLGKENVSGRWTLTAQAFTLDTDGTSAELVASNALPFTVTVTAVADAPNLSTETAVNVDEDAQVSLGLHAALVDTDSESLTVTITGAPDGSLIRVNTGTDDNPVWTDIHGQDGVWTVPAGTATSLDNVFIKPPADYNGSFTLSVTASSTEQAGGSATTAPKTIAVTVDAINDAPTAHLVSGGVGIEGGTHNTAIKLLGSGDSVTFDDVDFHDVGAAVLLSKMTVSISGGSGLSADDALGLAGVPVTLAADGTLVTQPDGDTTIAIAYDPATHTLTFSGNGTPEQYAALARNVVISSTSGTLTAGTREVTIAAYDQDGLQSAATPAGGVTVTVNGAVTLTGAALGDVAFSASGAPVLPTGTVATSEDAVPVALNLDMVSAAAATVAVTIAGMPAGTVFRDADGAEVLLADLTVGDLAGLKVDLPDNWNGSATLTVTANANGTIMTETVTLTATAVNDAPTTAAVTLAGTAEDGSFTFTKAQLLASAADVDGDTLAVSALSALHGTITDNGNNTFTYTPAADYHGTDAITYTIGDGHSGTVTGTANFTVTSVNDAPLLSIDHTSQTIDGSAGTVSAPVYVVPHDANVGISDADGTIISGMTVQLLPDAGGHYAVGDTLGLYGHDVALNQSCQLVVKGTDILVSYDDRNHTLSFSGDGSYATYADLAKSVVLSNTGSSLPTGTRGFGVTMYDESHAAAQTVTTSVNVSNGTESSVTLSHDAHGTIYWDGLTPVLNGGSGDDSFQVVVGTDWSVNGAGGNDTLTLNCQNGGWTFALVDNEVHVTSTTDPGHSGILNLDPGAEVQPFADGSHDIVFNGSASGTIDFGADHTVTFSNLEKIHG